MQVFNAYMKVLKKKLPVAMIYVIVFLTIAFPMSRAGANSDKFEATKLDICIFDEDNTPESKALCDLIVKDNDIVELENDKDVITDALYYESADYVLIINKGYAEKLAEGDTEEIFGSYHLHDSYSIVYVEQFLNEYTSAVKAYLAGGLDLDEAVKSAGEAVSVEAEVNYESFDEDNSSADFPKAFSFYFQYMPYILLSVMISALCPILLTMGRKDIRYRTNCSSVRPSSYTMQILAGSALFVIALWLIFAAAGAVLYGGMYQGKGWYAVLNSFIFSLVAASIAVLVASFSPSDRIVSLITQVVGLGMSFLCGIFVPMSMLGEGVLAAGRFLPAYWYIKANNMLAGSEPYDGSKLMQYMLIEAAFAVVLAILSLVVNRVKYTGGLKAKGAAKAAA